MSEIEITENEETGYRDEIPYAGFWIRVAAGLIDMLVFLPIIALGQWNVLSIKSLTLVYVATIISALYKPLMEWKYGATLGKMVVKVKVVNYDLKPINIDQAFTRYLPWAISTIFQLLAANIMFNAPGFESIDTYMEMGQVAQNGTLSLASQIYNILFLIIIIALVFDKKKRGLHDKMAKTVCIRTKKADQ